MPANPKPMPSPSTASTAKPKRPTVASLASELEELRAQIATLQTRLETMENADRRPITFNRDPNVIPAAMNQTKPVSKPQETLQQDPLQDIYGLLSQAFALAMLPMPDDPDEATALFKQFCLLFHSSRTGTPMLETSLRNYTWGQLRKNVLIYLEDPTDTATFSVARTDPSTLGKNATRLKLFINATTRMPTPITFRRDEANDQRWRIEASSL